MKPSILIAAYALTWTSAYTQWTINYSSAGKSLNDVYCIDGSTCFAVGLQSVVLKTTDGVNWAMQNNGINPSEGLNSVFCTDVNTCYITGGNSVYKTTDGGAFWNEYYVVIAPNKLSFVTDSVGYAGSFGGGQYIKTTDAGNTWMQYAISGYGSPVNGFYFTDTLTGYAVGYSWTTHAVPRILKTTDAGTNWSYIYADTFDCILNDIAFINDSTGIAVGSKGNIWRTTDSGASWSKVSAGDSVNNFKCVFFPTENVGYISGTFGTIKKSTDGGQSWVSQASPVNALLEAVHCIEIDTCYASAVSAIIKTTNGGVVSIEELSSGSQIGFIYPNPISEYINLEIPGSAHSYHGFKLTLYNAIGEVLLTADVKYGNNIISRGNLSSGLYIYKLYNDNAVLAAGSLLFK